METLFWEQYLVAIFGLSLVVFPFSVVDVMSLDRHVRAAVTASRNFNQSQIYGIQVERKLVAILAADVVGYSKLMAADEDATFETLRKFRSTINKLVEKHNGRIFNTAGDAFLAEFSSAVEAVRCYDLSRFIRLVAARRRRAVRRGNNRYVTP